jgi:hypothetical protein
LNPPVYVAATGACAPAPAQAQDVTLDPACSPSGSTLAYATAPQDSTNEFLPGQVAQWYSEHSLALYTPRAGTTSSTTDPGASIPLWASNGSDLVYESNDALWLTTPSTSPVRIAGPLFARTDPPSYYGEMDWAQQFGWSNGGRALSQCYVACDTAPS